jgi:hypothetical protein
MTFRNIGEVIARTKTTAKFKRGLERANVFGVVRKIIEKLIGFDGHTLDQEINFEFRGNILTVKCSSSYLAQEIRFYQEEIKKKTNSRTDGFFIKEIRVKVGKY